jgi:AcrR family transcriptional regulator
VTAADGAGRSSRPDGAATRERIMAVALEQFSQRGIDAVSTRDILTQAGVNAGAIHYHFRSKRNLVIELMQACFETVRALEAASYSRLEEDPHPSAPAVVEAVAGPMAILAKSPEGRHTVRFLLESWRHPAYQELHQSYEESMTRRRLAAVARVAPHLTIAEQVVWTIMLTGIAVRFIANGEADAIAEAVAPPDTEIAVFPAVVRFLTEALAP